VAEETEGQAASAAAMGGPGVDPVAMSLALGAAAQNQHVAAKAEAFLEQQKRVAVEQEVLVRLQAKELAHELNLRRWSLRVRHVSDVMKLAFEVAVAFIVLALAVGLGAAIWSASRADGLVIESIEVPAALAAHGLTGQVVANKLLDRLTVMQNATRSSRAASSFANDWTNDIKVEIPDTGVSLGEAMRYLHNALGHEVHLSGEAYDTANGIALTLRLDDQPGQTFEGKLGDLNSIVEQGAEAIFRNAQPYRYSVFLMGRGRNQEGDDVREMLVRTGPPNERAWGYNGMAIHAQLAGQYDQAEAYARRALAENPTLPNPMSVISGIELRRGHDEESLAADLRTEELYRGPGAGELDPATVKPSLSFFEIKVAELAGDFRLAISQRNSLTPVPGLVGPTLNSEGEAIDAAMLHDAAAARAHLAMIGPIDPAPIGDARGLAALVVYARGMAAIAAQDWQRAIQWLEQSETMAREIALASKGSYSDRLFPEIYDGPWLAYAFAMTGERARADAVLRTLARDCYICTRLRGRVDTERGNWSGAAYWFADAARQAPSLPFADTDWGAMLLRHGDYDAAIAKFTLANQKGPHFADPLEMWGEALIAKNRSDLALAKFEEANKYAPHWGHLHLKWGEALLWSGDKDGARKQLAIATHLDLSAADKAALTRVSAMHG